MRCGKVGKLGGGYCFFSLFFFWPFLLLFTSTRFCIIIIFGIREKEREEKRKQGRRKGEKKRKKKDVTWPATYGDKQVS